MKKLICALIGAAALVASATTYIQTSSTGTAPWKPVKDSVSQAHLADSARHAPPSAYADSSRASGLADSAKRAGWAPLDSGRVRGIVGDTATVLRTYIGSASTTGNAATSTKLATARTIATSGDVTGTPTAFDGTANITIPTVLPTLLTAGSAGSATTVPTLTWDAKGRLTAAGNAAISVPHTQINDWSSYVSTAAIGALPCAGVSGSVDFNNIASKVAGAYPIFGTTSYSNAPPGLAVNNGGGMLWQGFGANNLDWNAQIFVDAQQDALWYRTEGSPATWRSWRQLLTSTSSIPHTQISDWSTATSLFLTANQSISLTGAVTGSGTTSIPTSFANTHLAGINQDLTSSSSPTFTNLTLTMGAPPSLSFAPWAASPSLFDFIGPAPTNTGATATTTGIVVNAVNLNLIASSNVDIWAAGTHSLNATNSLLSVFSPLTVSGLITANGGISGNLTGHASLDIPLTGSSAITGNLDPIGSTYSVGSSSAPWGEIHAGVITANTVFYGNRLESTSYNILSLVGGTSVAINVGNNNLLNISNSSTTIYNPLTVSGLITANGGLDLAKNLQSSTYTITSSDQGKMVISNNTLNLPSFSAGTNVGFWCLVNWHGGGGGAVFGPTTSGTTWILRGQYIHVSTSTPFTGVVSWDGYNWYAN